MKIGIKLKMKNIKSYELQKTYTILFSFCDPGTLQCSNPDPSRACRNNSGDSASSNLLFSGYFVGALLALLPFGILADRIGNLKVIGFGVLLTVLSGLVISLF